jgi:hypothetical protein
MKQANAFNFLAWNTNGPSAMLYLKVGESVSVGGRKRKKK